MVFTARVIRVLIASPSDTTEERQAIEDTMYAWNRDHSERQKVVLQPLRWEVDSVPELGADPQEVLNRQLVDRADILVGAFWSRLGSPTARGRSGTVEEVQRSDDQNKPVHVYFSERPLPPSIDADELRDLREFQDDLRGRALYGTYASIDDLRWKVQSALTKDVYERFPDVAREEEAGDPGEIAGAVLRVYYKSERLPEVDSKGRTRYKTRGERLVVENVGVAAVEELSGEIEPLGDGDAPRVFDEIAAERIPPRNEVSFSVMTYAGVAQQWRVRLAWKEAGSEHSELFTVTH